VGVKIRYGFVSNSSSSSFAIYGKCFDEGALKARFKFTDDDLDDIYENGLYEHQCGDLGGLEYVYLDEDQEWIIGVMLSGTSKDICTDVIRMDKIFGDGCKLYRGVDDQSVGSVQLDG
jgi:hypothetical protein